MSMKQDVFAGESPLLKNRNNWDEFDSTRTEELEEYDAFDLDDYGKDADEDEL